jgi:hypothetical protein
VINSLISIAKLSKDSIASSRLGRIVSRKIKRPFGRGIGAVRESSRPANFKLGHYQRPSAICELPENGLSQLVDAAPSDVEVVIMRQGRRYGLSAAHKPDIWRRWKTGESLHEIGRAFGKNHGSIQFLLSQHGGIAPLVRRRSRRGHPFRGNG